MSRISTPTNRSGLFAVLAALAVMLGWATPVQAGEAFKATFPHQTPTRFIAGAAEDVPFAVEGKVPAKGDVLVLAWSEGRRQMVGEFAHTLRSQPWRISAKQLEKLPDGRNELQLLSRINGKIHAKTTHVIEKITINPRDYRVTFPKDAPDQHAVGDGQPIDLDLSSLPPNGDLLVLAWHHDQRRMIESFAHTLTAPPFRITAARLDALPAGRVELQVMLRINNKPVRGDKMTLTIAHPVALPTLSFENQPASYQIGSGATLGLNVSGKLPAGAELIVQAWDEQADKLVETFTYQLDGTPFQISAAKLDTLPSGDIRLQALLRYQGEIRQTVGHTIAVVRKPVAPQLPQVNFAGAPTDYVAGSGKAITIGVEGPLPKGADILILAWSDAEKRMVDSFAQTFTSTPVTISGASIDSLPAGDVQLQALVRLDNQVKARVTHDLTLARPAPKPEEPQKPQASVAFAPGSPAVYMVGSGSPVYFNINGGGLGDNEDVLAIAWSTEQKGMVSGFSRRFVGPPHRIESAWLDTFPAGAVQLQLLLRRDHQVVQKATHWVLIVRPGDTGGDPDDGKNPGHDGDNGQDNGSQNPGDDDQAGNDNGNPGDQPGNGDSDSDDDANDDGSQNPGDDDPHDGGSDPGAGTAGWTVFTKSSDTRVIYVAANGSDSNDGRSPAQAVKTPERGYALLRDNSADWLLFRRGDTFDLPPKEEGNFREWRKSGRSPSEKIVVGAYGDLSQPRPVLNSNGRGVLSANSGQSVSHVAFVDLHFYANRRDPSSRDFDGGAGYEYGLRWSQSGSRDVLFEGLLIEYFANNVDIGAPGGKTDGPTDVTFRRCVIRRSYSHRTKGHSQGMNTANTTRLTLDSCIIDHNGYEKRVSASKRTGFNHGIYLYHTKGTRIINCIFARNGYGGIKGRGDREGDIQDLLVKDNVFTDEIVGVYIGGDKSSGDPDALVNHGVVVQGNLFTRIGGQIDGTEQGFAAAFTQVKDGTMERNLFVHKTVSTNFPAIELNDWAPQKNLLIKRNVVHEWPRPYTKDKLWCRGMSKEVKAESNLAFEPASIYVDASRTMDKYAKAAGYSSMDTFCDAVSEMRKGNWPEKMSANDILTYFRHGYTLKPAD